MHKPSTHVANPDDGFELTDVQIKIILWAGVAMIVLTGLAFFVSFLYAKMLIAEQRAPLTQYEASNFVQEHNEWASDVRLQPSPPASLEAHNAEQRAVSNDWGIVSESPVIYQIPVNVALDHIAEHGLPIWTPENVH